MLCIWAYLRKFHQANISQMYAIRSQYNKYLFLYKTFSITFAGLLVLHEKKRRCCLATTRRGQRLWLWQQRQRQKLETNWNGMLICLLFSDANKKTSARTHTHLHTAHTHTNWVRERTRRVARQVGFWLECVTVTRMQWASAMRQRQESVSSYGESKKPCMC